MASINFNPFESWFSKPPNPVPFVNLHSISQSLLLPKSSTTKFASISSSLSGNGKQPEKDKEKQKEKKTEEEEEEEDNGFLDFYNSVMENSPFRHIPEVEKTPKKKPAFKTEENPTPEEPGPYSQMLDQFFWECENLPDHRHTPEVEKILKEDPAFETKENPTPEEIKENEQWWQDFRSSPVLRFIQQAEQIKDDLNELELKENMYPFHGEDTEMWRAVPHVPGPDGRPMPRMTIKSQEARDSKFLDFMTQFLFGLWGFRQRPYPAGRPIDVAQAYGYKNLERRYYDLIMKTNGWFYKDRLGRTRGPMEVIQLKTAFGAGIIDKDTFIWGEDMDEWAPIHMVYGLERAIVSWDVRFAAAATELIHKIQKGIPLWAPVKGREKKTYKELQEEAIESKKRDLAVLEANDGIWPGVRIPSHAMFLWASGTELTSTLEADHMPNKFVPKHLRKVLEEIIPGLRPWEVLSVEQAMDEITYGGKWYREHLSHYSTGPPYLKFHNDDWVRWIMIHDAIDNTARWAFRRLPGWEKVLKIIRDDAQKRRLRRRRLKGMSEFERKYLMKNATPTAQTPEEELEEATTLLEQNPSAEEEEEVEAHQQSSTQ